MAHATAFVALFPFDILVISESVTPFDMTLDGRRITLYWPFWHEVPPGRRIERLRVERVPSRPGIQFYAEPPLELQIEIQPPDGGAFANGLRIDIAGDADEQFATEFVTRVLQQFRLRTGQWWIGHTHHDGEGVIRAAYSVDSRGSMMSRECRAGALVEPRLGSERLLAREDFTLACHALVSDADVPPYLDILYDAIYFSIHNSDRRRALLEACIACDMAVIYQAIRAGKEAGKPELLVRKILSDRDLLMNLRHGLPDLFGPQADYSEVSHTDYDLIRQLWAVRGAIAHGLAPGVGSHGRGQLPSQQETADLLMASQRLISWLEAFP
jgi:hypothetical protein